MLDSSQDRRQGRWSAWLSLCLWAIVLLSARATASAKIGSVEVLEDTSGRMGLTDVLDARMQARWRTSADGRVPNFGISRSVYWVRCRMAQERTDTGSQVFLVQSSVIDTLDIFQLRGSEAVQTVRTGDARPYRQRPVPYRQFAVAWRGDADSGTVFCLRVASQDGLHESMPLSNLGDREFQELRNLEQFHFGVYFGVIAFLALFSGLLYVTLRKRSQLYFAAYSLFYGWWNLDYQGFGDVLFWPDRPMGNLWLMVTSLVFATLLVLFSRRFLQLARETPRLHRGLGILLALDVAVAVPLIAGDRYCRFFLWTMGMDVLLLVLLLGSGIRSALRGKRSGQLFLVSWSLIIFGAILYIAKVVGLVPSSPLIYDAYQYGTVLQAIVLSIGVALMILKAQKQSNRTLEATVSERTRELETANLRLRELSDTDHLTGLPNRRRFDERFEAIHRLQERNGSCLALLLMDIDHFKLYNDTYGHQEGDRCLRAVAQAIRAALSRGTDFCARYGGEEFIAYLPNTDLEGARTVAGKICRSVQACALEHRASPVAGVVTLSIGVAIRQGDGPDPLEAMVRRADQGLYAAKSQGRNCVQVGLREE